MYSRWSSWFFQLFRWLPAASLISNILSWGGHQQIVENLAANYNGVVPQLRVIMHYNALYRNILVYHFWNFGSRQRVVMRYNAL